MVLGLHARSDRDRFLDAQAQTVHAGIDVQGRAAVPGCCSKEGIPFGKLGDAVDDGPKRSVSKTLCRSGHHAVEHVDGGRGCNRPYSARFDKVCNEEGVATRLGKPARHRIKTAAIGICLDYCRALDRQSHGGERLPVRLDGGKIDGEDAAGLALAGSERPERDASQGRERSSRLYDRRCGARPVRASKTSASPCARRRTTGLNPAPTRSMTQSVTQNCSQISRAS